MELTVITDHTSTLFLQEIFVLRMFGGRSSGIDALMMWLYLVGRSGPVQQVVPPSKLYREPSGPWRHPPYGRLRFKKTYTLPGLVAFQDDNRPIQWTWILIQTTTSSSASDVSHRTMLETYKIQNFDISALVLESTRLPEVPFSLVCRNIGTRNNYLHLEADLPPSHSGS